MQPLLVHRPANGRFWILPTITAVTLVAVVLLLCEVSIQLAPLLISAVVAPYLAAIDWREHRLPDRLVVPSIVLTLVSVTMAAAVHSVWTQWGTALACGVGVTVFFGLMYALAPHHMGFGDVKLMMFLGVMLGWQGVFAVLAGVIVGLMSAVLVAIFCMVFTTATAKTHFALGPHLLLGALVVGVLTY